ncbi:hypothetical protein J5N97_023913 [Dioscorea zingiberensis]|uniref:Uncharacterized protein n=1 Tax=Dioscorea zingiberensis TaxID=325984 RepID=A0A9D5C5Q9_9LILI|nr:hypothetical protein J5N97_023913 [Dioscorea zingiberensis]
MAEVSLRGWDDVQLHGFQAMVPEQVFLHHSSPLVSLVCNKGLSIITGKEPSTSVMMALSGILELGFKQFCSPIPIEQASLQ